MRVKSYFRVLAIVAVTTLVSCSPKSVPIRTETKNYDLPADTSRNDSLVPHDNPQVDSKPIELNILTFCDSVEKGLIQLPYHFQTEKPTKEHTKKNIVYLDIDSTGHAQIYASSLAYQDTVKQLREVINNHHVKEVTITKEIRMWYDDFFRYGFFTLLIILAILLTIIIRAIKSVG